MKQKKKTTVLVKQQQKKSIKLIKPTKKEKTFPKKVLISLAILFVILFILVFFSSQPQILRGNAAQPITSPIVPTFGSIGDCTTNGNCPTGAVSPGGGQQISIQPGTSGAPAPSLNPSSNPAPNPCTNANNAQVTTMSKNRKGGGSQGFFQLILQFFQMLLQLLQQLLGGGTTTTPTPGTPQPQPSGQPIPNSGAPAPSQEPCPPTSSAPQPSGSQQPTSATVQPTSAPAQITTTPQKPSTSCAPATQTITVNGKQWVRTSNNWGGANVCLNTWDGKSVSYRIDSQNAKPSGGVMGYPDLSQGYDFGGGGPTSGWTSKQISALTNPEVTWVTSQANAVSGSKYDTGADLWFSTTPNFTNRAAEILISLNNQGEPPSTSKQITLSGVNYYFYVVPQHGWNEIIFARVQPTSSVTNLALLPFFQYCVSQGLMTSSEYWVNAGFGNEIWQLGTGLEVDNVSLTE